MFVNQRMGIPISFACRAPVRFPLQISLRGKAACCSREPTCSKTSMPISARGNVDQVAILASQSSQPESSPVWFPET